MKKNIHKQNLIDLYLKSFDDDIKYVNYFFDNFYKKKDCVSLYESGKCASALHLVDKELSFLNVSIKCPYIFAASTMTEFRNQGYFSKVLKKTFEKLYKRGINLCALYPFEHSFYQKFGFATVCYVKNTTLNFNGFVPKLNQAADADNLTGIYNEYFKNFDIYIKRNNKEMQKKIDECLVSGGELAVLDNSYVLYDKTGSEVVLNKKKTGASAGLNGLNNFTVQTYSEKFDIPYTMVRIVNVRKMLMIIPYKCQKNSIKLKITDEFYSRNNVTLEIKIKNNRAKVRNCKEYDEEISVFGLCLLVFGTYKSQDFSKKLSDIFPKKKTYLIDQI